MISKVELRKAVETSSYNVKDDEIFVTKTFEQMLQATVNALCSKFHRVPVVKLVADNTGEYTASTDGKKITINPFVCFMDYAKSRWEKYLILLGLAVHESGHVLFTPFQSLMDMFEDWLSDDIKLNDDTDKEKLKEIKEFKSQYATFYAVFVDSMRDDVNIIEDTYIEKMIRKNFGGLATMGLNTKTNKARRLLKPIELFLDKAIKGEILPVTVLSQCLYGEKLGEGIKMEKEQLNESQKELFDKVLALLDEIRDELDITYNSSNTEERISAFNKIFVKVFDFAKSYAQSEEQMKKSGNNPSVTAKELLKAEGVSQEPTGTGNPVKMPSKNKSDSASTDESEESTDNPSKTQQRISEELENVVREVKREKVIENLEKQHIRVMSEECQQLLKLKTVWSRSYDGITFATRERDKDHYDYIYAQVKTDVTNLARVLKNALKTRKPESFESGYMMGQKFNPLDTIRKEKKCFSRMLEPDGQPDLAVALLVDESGSMYGENNEIARKQAIFLDAVLNELDIPHQICGHTTYGNDVIIYNYVDYDRITNNDRYALSKMSADSGNIDGAVITYMGEKLLKRAEAKKILIVISDGLPAGTSFYADNCDEDTALAVKKYRKLGINVFGAVVEDFETVADIYGKEYCFDCRENGELRKQFIKLIKKYVLMKG